MMSARFAKLSILGGTIAILTLFVTTNTADASENKTRQIIDIKNFKTIKIPELPTVKMISDLMKNSEKVEISQTTTMISVVPTPSPVPTTAITEVKSKFSATKIANYEANDGVTPAKAVGAERVYMHEPEIRAYVCPKLGDKCNTFIAILKAENGSHECTRDNRGLNRNGTIDIGLTQINWSPSSPYSFKQLQDCKFNLDIAMKKYETRGFQPWAAYNSGRYLKHLPAVLASAATLEAEAAKATTASALSVN